MLVTYDQHYQIRDIYFPHVGQENHVGGGPCRFGVYADIPKPKAKERRRQRLAWTYDAWQIQMKYKPDSLVSDVGLHHEDLNLDLLCNEVVDFHRNIMVRRITVTNLEDAPRRITLYHHNDFRIFGTKIGDTVYYDPTLCMMVHYRQQRYMMVGFYTDGELRLDEYATGNSGYGGAEGTWRDAEDGSLGMNPIAQGAVDSTIGLHLDLPASSNNGGQATAWLIIGAGASHEDMVELQRFVHRDGPQHVIDRTEAYWRLWSWANNWEFADLPDPIVELFRRSLLILRTQIDNNGAIIAANDSDIMQFSRDTYSYMWPRDGALVAHALDLSGYPEVTRRFYYFASQIISDQGYFHHKYNPDGSLASSWHPWLHEGHTRLPIQEDETALVIWALWQHYFRYRDIEFVRPLWMRLIQPAAEFMVRFRDPATKLPLPSYDLWEERWGIHAFTVGTVYGGLMAARNFAVCFGDQRRAKRYGDAAEEIREGFCKHMWSTKHDRFLRRIEPLDLDRAGRLIDDVSAGHDPAQRANGAANDKVEFYEDPVVDSSLYGIYKFQLLDVDDPRVEKTMNAVVKHLQVKTEVGGLARYTDDYYHRVSDQIKEVPGNPWYICTLWHADWQIARAKNQQQLREVLPIMNWVVEHALPSGGLAEQVHPHTGAPLSVSPLTWSHATMVGCVIDYLEKLAQLNIADPDHGPHYRLRGRGQTRIADKLIIDRFEAIDMASPVKKTRGRNT